MKLTRLALTDFRNYGREVWSPEASVLVLTGENGSGKTNLLEALSLLAPGRGLRGAPLQALCRTGAAEWGVAATFQSGADVIRIGTGALYGSAAQGPDPARLGGERSERQRRTFLLEGEVVRSHAVIGDLFSCVWLTPQMDRLFQESAGGRRRFLDRLVMALSPDHGRQIAAHDRSVASRNRILLERPGETAWLSAVEDSIARHAVAACAARYALVENMNAHPFENAEFPKSLLRLECVVAERLSNHPALDVEDWLRERLEQSRALDREKGVTSVGAHRSDFQLLDATTGRPAELSSSGQQKVMLIGTVLAHAALIHRERGHAPTLLLDEPLLHLDRRRRHVFLRSFEGLGAPVVMTGTEADAFAPLAGSGQFFSVAGGMITPSQAPRALA